MVPFERALVSFYRPSIVTFRLFYAFQRYCRFCSPACHFYPTPLIIGLKFRVCSLWSRSVMLGSAESQVPKLIIREIIFAEFQRVWSQATDVTDRQTDNLSWQYRATLRFARWKHFVLSYDRDSHSSNRFLGGGRGGWGGGHRTFGHIRILSTYVSLTQRTAHITRSYIHHNRWK